MSLTNTKALRPAPVANSKSGPDIVQRPSITRRVLFVASCDNDGGIERHSARLAAHLSLAGAKIVYACKPNGIVENLAHSYGVSTIAHRPLNSGDVVSSFKLASHIVKSGSDVVHVHSRRDYVPALAAVGLARLVTPFRKQKVRLLLHVHLVRNLGTDNAFNAWVFRRLVDGVLVVSSAVRENVLEDDLVPANLVKVMHNGVDLSAFAEVGSEDARDRRRRARTEWGLKADAYVIGMVGRLDAKGQERMLQRMSVLTKAIPNLYLVLVGPDGHIGNTEKLEAEAREYGISDHVIIPGPTSDVPAAMAGFDVLAHLPDDDALPSALIEAMAAGVPVVAANIGGCPEIVRDGVTGILVEQGDTAALDSAITRFFDDVTGHHLRQKMGDAGGVVARADFSLTRQVKDLLNLYESGTLEAGR
ncbi:MAG TPA: glycosyltransferase family 4 protein [Capsulimonadaceae bacterium]|jgi:glycosyltransferase involved in cell wall biosynthesis